LRFNRRLLLWRTSATCQEHEKNGLHAVAMQAHYL